MPEHVNLSAVEFPELDGAIPDFHATQAQRVNSATAARRLLGAVRWPEDLLRPAPDWLIPGFLQRQAIHVVSAPKSARKTWLGLYTMLCGVYQLPWFGQPSQQFESIYLAADSPRWDVRTQLRKLVRGAGQTPQSLTDSGSFLLPYGFKFTNQEHVTAMTQLVTTWGIQAIFIDVLLYTHDGLNENDNSDMGYLFKVVKFFRDSLGLAVVLLHHHAKDPTVGARGAGTILQAAEHHYELRRKGDVTVVRREKIRGDDSATWNEFSFRLHSVDEGCTLQFATAPTNTEPPNPIVLALRTGPQTRADLVAVAVAHGYSTRWTDSILSDLREAGVATSANGVWSLC